MILRREETCLEPARGFYVAREVRTELWRGAVMNMAQCDTPATAKREGAHATEDTAVLNNDLIRARGHRTRGHHVVPC